MMRNYPTRQHVPQMAAKINLSYCSFNQQEEKISPILANLLFLLLQEYYITQFIVNFSKYEIKYEEVKVLVTQLSLVTPWAVAHWAPLSMEFSRQQHWSE